MKSFTIRFKWIKPQTVRIGVQTRESNHWSDSFRTCCLSITPTLSVLPRCLLFCIPLSHEELEHFISLSRSHNPSLHPPPHHARVSWWHWCWHVASLAAGKAMRKCRTGAITTRTAGQVFLRSSCPLGQFPPFLLRDSRVTMGAEWADLMDVFSFVRMPKLSGWVRHFPALVRLLRRRWRDTGRHEQVHIRCVCGGVLNSFVFFPP